MPNYLFGGGDGNVTVGPVGSLVGGFQAGSNVMNQISRTNLMAEEEQRKKIITAMKLHDDMKGMAYNNLDFYNNAYRPALIKMGVPEGLLPTYDNVDEMNKRLYQNEQIKALYKQKMEGPKVVPERGAVYLPGQGFQYPEVSPARNAMLASDAANRQARFDLLSQKFGQDKALQIMKNEHALGQIEARGNIEKPGSYEMVETDEGLGWSPKGKGEIIPIPGAKGKAKAGSDIELRKFAIKSTIDSGMLPDNPNFESTVQKNMNILSGKKSSAQPSLKFPRTLRNSQTGESKVVNSQEEYDALMGK